MEARTLRRLLLSLVLAIAGLVAWRRITVGRQTYVYQRYHLGQDILIVYQNGNLYRAANLGWELIYSDTVQAWSANDGGAVYVDGADGLEVSLDGGETWSAATSPPVDSVQALSASPVSSTVFLIPDYYIIPDQPDPQAGIWKSTDFGVSWRKVYTGYARALHFSPAFAQDGLVFSEGAGYHLFGPLLRSTDWGESWERLPIEYRVGGTFLCDVAVSPAITVDHTVFALCDDKIFKSQDRGETWKTASELPTCESSLAISPRYSADRTLLAGPYLSQDGGLTWRQVFTQTGLAAVGIRLDRPFGDSHRETTEPFGPYRSYLPIVGCGGTPPLEFWIVTGTWYKPGLLYRSRDLGATWGQVAAP